MYSDYELMMRSLLNPIESLRDDGFDDSKLDEIEPLFKED